MCLVTTMFVISSPNSWKLSYKGLGVVSVTMHHIQIGYTSPGRYMQKGSGVIIIKKYQRGINPWHCCGGCIRIIGRITTDSLFLSLFVMMVVVDYCSNAVRQEEKKDEGKVGDIGEYGEDISDYITSLWVEWRIIFSLLFVQEALWFLGISVLAMVLVVVAEAPKPNPLPLNIGINRSNRYSNINRHPLSIDAEN